MGVCLIGFGERAGLFRIGIYREKKKERGGGWVFWGVGVESGSYQNLPHGARGSERLMCQTGGQLWVFPIPPVWVRSLQMVFFMVGWGGVGWEGLGYDKIFCRAIPVLYLSTISVWSTCLQMVMTQKQERFFMNVQKKKKKIMNFVSTCF